MKNKKKILFVMDGMKIGGVESALISVFHCFDFDHNDVDLLLLHDDDELKDEVPKEVDIHYLSNAKSSGRGICFLLFWLLYRSSAFLRFRKLTRSFSLRMMYAVRRKRGKSALPGQYETVIAYKQGEAESFVAFCMKAKNKILFYHHGSIIDDNLHRRAFPHFQKIVAVSEGVREMLAKQYPEEKDKLCVIPNFVDPEYIKQKAAAYAVNRPGVPLILCTTGRFSPEKNFLLALKTAEELKKRNISFVWFMVGDGEQREELEIYRNEHALQNEAIFTGALPNPLPYVSLCDVYIQPSMVESYGLSIQEALVLKKPVVSTKTIGGQTLLTDAKYSALVDSDADSMADGICRLLESGDREEDPIWKQKDFESKKLWRGLLH